MRTNNLTQYIVNFKNTGLQYSVIALFILLSNSYLQAQMVESFGYTGAEQTWTVPLGVTSIDIYMTGAQGGASTDAFQGGHGGSATGTLSVTPGELLYIYVGGEGQRVTNETISGGGFNGGGNTYGNTGNPRGGGGGGSDVRRGGNGLSDRVIVAGGGGGTGSGLNAESGGSGGGLSGEDSFAANPNLIAYGGTQTAGGAGASNLPFAEDGTFGLGGNLSEITTDYFVSGGGGGWYGGGVGPGGGGGSSYIDGVTNGTTNLDISEGNGYVEFTYFLPPGGNCIYAETISCGQEITNSTTGETVDNPPDCFVEAGLSGGKWFRFIGTGESVTFSTCNSYTNFSAQVSVYSGPCNNLVCVPGISPPDVCDNAASITVETSVGVDYRVWVNGANGEEGDFLLSMDCPNTCETANPIACGDFKYGTTHGANIPDVTDCGGNGIGPGTWYKMIGTGTCGFISTCELENNTFDTQISVYEGTCDNLVCVAYNDDDLDVNNGGCSTIELFGMEAGKEYFILVNGKNGETGDFVLEVVCYNLTLEITCPPAIELSCEEIVPEAANTISEFLAQGGMISGLNNCTEEFLTITHTDFTMGNTCQGIEIQRVYVVSNELTNESSTCEQPIFIHEPSGPTIDCGEYDNEVTCADEINPSENDVVITVDCDVNYTLTIEGPTNVTEGTPDCNGEEYIVWYTVEDQCGETATCFRKYYIVNEGTVITQCPADKIVACEDDIVPDFDELIVSHPCGLDIEIVAFPPELLQGDPNCNGATYRISYEVYSPCGPKFPCDQIFTIQNDGPVVVVAPDVTVECPDDIIVSTNDIQVTTPCGGGVDIEIGGPIISEPGYPACNGTTYTYVYAFQDACKNEYSFERIFTIQNAGTQVVVAPDVFVECASEIEVSVDDVQVTTSCGIDYEVEIYGPSISDPNYPNCNGNTYTYKYGVVDACGYSYLVQRVFTIQNEGTQVEVAPDEIVECADDIEVSTDDILVSIPCVMYINIQLTGPVISDPARPNCSGTVHTYTYSFEDECGNQHAYQRHFTIENDPVELIKVDPYLNDIENNEVIQLQCYALDDTWSLPQFDASAFTAIASCDLDAEVVYQLVDLGAADCSLHNYAHRYQHVWTAMDECGTSDQFSFTIELVDNIPPVLLGVPADLSVECTESLPDIPEVIATDECECAHISFEETELESNTCTGDKTIIRTWTAVDHCGNVTQESQQILVKDQTNPAVLFSMQGEDILNNDVIERGCGIGEYPNWVYQLNENSITVFEECSQNTSISFMLNEDIPYSCTSAGYLESYNPTWTVTDDCGNSTSFSFTVKVLDDEAPTIFASDVLYICSDSEEGYALATDDCSDFYTYHFDEPADGCGDGFFNRIYTFEDACGNISTQEQLVIHLDENPDLIVMNEEADLTDVVYQCDSNNDQYTEMSIEDVKPAMDCLTDLEIQFSETLIPNSCNNGGSQLQLLWTATTACGYVDSIEYFIEVIDNTAPFFPDFEEELVLNCSDPMPVVYAEDDCNEVTLDIIEEVENGNCPNEKTITRTITATDICGNASTVTQTVHYIDEDGPVFDLAPSVCEDETNDPVLAYDECSGNSYEASLLNEEIINDCSAFPITERIWMAEDACGNSTTFVQLVYPENYSLEYEVLNSELNYLLNNEISTILKSDNIQMGILNQLSETSVIAYDPCGKPVVGGFSKTTVYHDACTNGIGETVNYSWNFGEVCGEVYEYVLSFDIHYDIPPVIEIEEELNVYCSDVLPELIIDEQEGLEYTVQEYDERDEYGNGDVVRVVTVTDVCGNTSFATQTIHVFYTSDLSCGIDGDFTPACSSSNNIYTVEVSGGMAPYTINWYVVGGNCSIEATYGNTVEIYVGYGQATIVAEVMDANGCMTECKAIVSCEGTGFNPSIGSGNSNQNGFMESDPNVKLHPNPFTNHLVIELENATDDQYSILLLNNLGEAIYNTKLSGYKMMVDLSAQPAGVYFLRVEGGHFRKVLKVIKVEQ